MQGTDPATRTALMQLARLDAEWRRRLAAEQAVRQALGHLAEGNPDRAQAALRAYMEANPWPTYPD